MARKRAARVALFALALMLAGLSGQRVRDNQTAATLTAMEAYLVRIGPGLTGNLEQWATEHNWPAWLCGPTSYALAEELNRRFFDSSLPIVGTPNGDCIHVRAGSVRVPIGGGKYRTGDHAWVEIHWRGLMIVIDPTYAQLDRQGSIVFAWFLEDDTAGYDQFMELLRLGPVGPGASDELAGDAEWIARALNAGLPPRDWLVWSNRLRRESFQ